MTVPKFRFYNLKNRIQVENYRLNLLIIGTLKKKTKQKSDVVTQQKIINSLFVNV